MKKILKNKYFPFILFFLIILIEHVFMPFIGDDILFKATKDNYFDLMKFRYFNWTSRLIIESVLNLFVRMDYSIWKVIDSFIYTLGVYLVLKLVNKNAKPIINYIGCLLFLIYSYTEMGSAGFIATTTNYMWSFVFGLLSLLPLINKEQNKDTNKIIYIISFLGLIYSTNQEQCCALILGFNLLYFINTKIKKEKSNKYNILCIILSIISLIFIITCPGNNNRVLMETKTWFPNFNKLNFSQKLYLGIVPTMNLMLDNSLVLFTFTIILGIATIIYSKKFYSKIISLSTMIIVSCLTLFRNTIGKIIPQVLYLKEAFASQKSLSFDYHYQVLALIITIIIFSSLLYMILLIFKKKQLLPLFIFLAGSASRLIIGFSPTVFASSSRTCLFLYMSLFTILLLLIYKLYDDKKINKFYNISLIVFLLLLSIYNIRNFFIITL